MFDVIFTLSPNLLWCIRMHFAEFQDKWLNHPADENVTGSATEMLCTRWGSGLSLNAMYPKKNAMLLEIHFPHCHWGHTAHAHDWHFPWQAFGRFPWPFPWPAWPPRPPRLFPERRIAAAPARSKQAENGSVGEPPRKGPEWANCSP